jgi:hypothetical protein
MDEIWPDWSICRRIVLMWYMEPYKTKKWEKIGFSKSAKRDTIISFRPVCPAKTERWTSGQEVAVNFVFVHGM